MEPFSFTCKRCEREWEDREYSFGEAVTCPECKTVWQTDYDEGEDGLIGPWLTQPAK